MGIASDRRGRQESRGPRDGARRRLLFLAGATLLAFALYAGTLTYPLVWDDLALVGTVQRTLSRGLPGLLTAEFNLEPSKPTGYYRPVVLLSLRVDSLLAPRFPPSYHFTNVILHSLATGLVFSLVALTVGSAGAGLAGALLFAVHPVHTEAVAFVSGRTDLWAALFLLASVLAWIRDRGAPTGARWPWRAAGVLSFALALLSKEVSFVLPAVLLVWDLLLPDGQDRAGRGNGWWRRNGFWIAGWGTACAAVIVLRVAVAGIGFGPAAANGGTFASGNPLVTALEIIATNVRLLAVPWPLNAYYTDDQLAFSPLTLAGCALFAAFCLALVRAGRGRAVALGLVWIGGFLLPTFNLVGINAAKVAERFLYFPSVGLALLVGYGWAALENVGQIRRRAISAVFLAVVAAFGYGTLARAQVWREEIVFFRDFARTSPRFAGAHFNLGRAYGKAAMFPEAVAAYEAALQLDPIFPQAHHDVALLYLGFGLTDKAREHCRELEKSDPEAARLIRTMIEFVAR